jgi:cytochrome c6
MKNKIQLYMAVIITFSVTGCSFNEPKTQPVATSPPIKENAVVHGKVLFEEKCVLCHGGDGTAGISDAANLRTSTLDTLSILKIITNGKNTMPAFGEQLGTGEIEQITSYIFTLRK